VHDSTPPTFAWDENIEDMAGECSALRRRQRQPVHRERHSPGRTPMHRTETIDYVIVLAGELEMQMDDSTVKLKAGDVLVQRGTNHAWINRGTEPRGRVHPDRRQAARDRPSRDGGRDRRWAG